MNIGTIQPYNRTTVDVAASVGKVMGHINYSFMEVKRGYTINMKIVNRIVISYSTLRSCEEVEKSNNVFVYENFLDKTQQKSE